MKFSRGLALCAGILLAPVVSAANFFDPLDGQLDMSDFLSENAYGFLPVPIIITDPAVEGGLGMMGLFFHESEEEKEKRMQAMRLSDSEAQNHLMPPSVSAIALAATGNKSWFTGGGHMGFFDQGRVRYLGGGGYGDVNLDFYGSGNIQLSKPIDIKTKAVMVMQALKLQVAETRWFVGLGQRYVSAEVSPNSFGDLDDYLPPEWSDALREILTIDTTTSGLGLVAEWDSRDNVFSPRKGYHYQIEYLWFRDELGSDLKYDLNHIQGLNYWQFNKRWRLGLKLEGEYADSDGFLPPYSMPSIKLRGVPAMRYQGKLVGTTETELTRQIDPRWSVNVFGGAGRASNSGGSFSEAETQNAYGLGFRYQMARRYGFDMGIDIARGPEDTVFYITAGTAWH